MRQDIYLYNDTGSWSVIADNAVAQIVEDNREHDRQFVIDFMDRPFLIYFCIVAFLSITV